MKLRGRIVLARNVPKIKLIIRGRIVFYGDELFWEELCPKQDNYCGDELFVDEL